MTDRNHKTLAQINREFIARARYNRESNKQRWEPGIAFPDNADSLSQLQISSLVLLTDAVLYMMSDYNHWKNF